MHYVSIGCAAILIFFGAMKAKILWLAGHVRPRIAVALMFQSRIRRVWDILIMTHSASLQEPACGVFPDDSSCFGRLPLPGHRATGAFFTLAR
jgi:hypothetical protein